MDTDLIEKLRDLQALFYNMPYMGGHVCYYQGNDPLEMIATIEKNLVSLADILGYIAGRQKITEKKLADLESQRAEILKFLFENLDKYLIYWYNQDS